MFRTRQTFQSDSSRRIRVTGDMSKENSSKKCTYNPITHTGKENTDTAKLILSLSLTILIMIFIFFQSSLPADVSEKESGLITVALAEVLGMDQEIVSFAVRKCAHFSEYMILGFSLLMTLQSYARIYLRKKQHNICSKSGIPARLWSTARGISLTAWCAGTIYAVSDEIHQTFVPGRSCEFRDMLIDSAGVFTAIFMVHLLYNAKRSRPH